MPTRCIVAGCSNTTKENVSLHRFPRDPSLRKVWTSKVKLTRANWAGPSDTSVICSVHFAETDFEEPGLWTEFGLKKQRRLKATAIPNIRSSSYEEPKRKQRESVEKRKKIRMLDELLSLGNPESTHDDDDDSDDDDSDNDGVDDINMPGPSWATDADVAPMQVEDVIPSSRRPATTCRSVGIQTKLKVPTRVKGVQMKPRTKTMGVYVCTLEAEQMVPIITSRGTSYDPKDGKVKERKADSPPSPDESSSSSDSPSPSPESPPSPTSKQPHSPGYKPDESSSSDEESSPRKAKKKRRGRKPGEQFVARSRVLPHEERKYIVFESNLMQLFKCCQKCSSGNVITTKTVIGTFLRVTCECVTCNNLSKWDSQPRYGSAPAGNILLSASTLFAGGSPSKTLRILNFLRVECISERTFFRHQRGILQPVVEKVWKSQQDTILEKLRARGAPLVIGGDGRADSPGHSAKYGAYTGIELCVKKIVDIQLVQSNEVKNSSHMELEGYKRLHQKLTNEDLTIGRLVTDRHRQLAKYVRETSPGIVHVHDVWHVAKGVTKKVHGLSKKKGCDVMGDWEQSVNNHMYWVASSTPEEEPELREAKWTSLANHIQNVHEGHSDVFPRCLHGDLDAGRRKRWLKPGTMVSEKFETIITSKTLIKDVKKMSNVEQTSYVESFHALINQFAPKMKAYKYHDYTLLLFISTPTLNAHKQQRELVKNATNLRSLNTNLARQL
ncbi:uncharacterized protein LOC129260174 isoform X2 [Lytechinus pictus]|uniref:uncharacterized protein LOC129260174 isoform X2 n=1 Tax=Lytechinus pictus TaxID=7653 RepID=UPI0030BA1F3C